MQLPIKISKKLLFFFFQCICGCIKVKGQPLGKYPNNFVFVYLTSGAKEMKKFSK